MRYNSILLLVLWVPFLLFYGCNQKKGRDASTSEDMVTAKTLGLAYLEENKLEEAEAEFLKLVELDPEEVMGHANLGIVYLRQGEYNKAVEWLEKAIKLDPEDPDVRLILAKVYEMNGQPEKSVEELEKLLRVSPGHVKSLYQITELYSSFSDPGSLESSGKYLNELVRHAPGNIVPQLNLIELLIRNGQTGQALERMEKLQQVFPEFPKESVEYHERTIAALRAGDSEIAAVSFMIFHNYLKVTAPYQAGIMDLKGPGGALIGFPVITFDQARSVPGIADWRARLESIKLKDITTSAGLDFLAAVKGSTHVATCDYDGDGDPDLYVGCFDPDSKTYKHYLLRNEWGVFTDVSEEAGIRHQGIENSCRFADYNNDGYPDLYVVKEGANVLYENIGEGKFEDVTKKAKVGDTRTGTGALFFDYDHDGDLDLFITREGLNLLYRNNADDTFTELIEGSSLAGGPVKSTDAGFGDFDDDGDIDLLTVNYDAPNTLHSNQRQGVFKDITDQSGLVIGKGSSAVAVGDYNNDGFLDLFIASLEAGQSRLFRNLGNGTFKSDDSAGEMYQDLGNVRAHDAAFLDFDNDGYLDLLVAGTSELESGSGVLLYHNDGAGKLWPAPGILPEDVRSGRDMVTFDYNDDGDLDVVLTGIDGGIRLLRNDGGNNNHYVKMKLVGLRTGSAKNNYYGVGAKVEIRSGSLYQSAVVTEPDIHFGLGPREKAEVIRILWTNGIPQNMFFPGTDQNLIEEQILKGSCPFLYTWNGEEYLFAKDIMWRSALGMPLGIMGEAAAYAPSDASVDYIKIPGELLMPVNNRYSIQVTSELWETIYMDKLELVVVDHPDSVEVFVDESLAPSATYIEVPPGIQVFQVSDKRIPVSATDHNGADLLPLLTGKDDRYVSGFSPGKFQGLTEISEMVLDLGELDHSREIHLFLQGWIFPTDASINVSMSQSDAVQMIPPHIQVINAEGEWETVIEDLSFPMGKDKTVVADLSGKLPGFDSRIRIRTNMEIYWDRVFYTQGTPEAPVQYHRLKPSSADLHFRGYSRSYRKGGRYGPHWFDYDRVTKGQKWRDLEGNYTRYGDVLPLLTEADDKYIIKNAGDETTIEFGTEELPGLPAGWTRDFLVHSIGWVKDGDLNTVTGNKVLPLPFHGMTSYPYGEDESYPSDPDHQEYLREYNTRRISTVEFRSALSGPH